MSHRHSADPMKEPAPSLWYPCLYIELCRFNSLNRCYNIYLAFKWDQKLMLIVPSIKTVKTVASKIKKTLMDIFFE